MGAPSPELCNLWLARAFNAQDVEAAAAMYHPDASIVQVDQVHGGTKTARGADGIRADDGGLYRLAAAHGRRHASHHDRRRLRDDALAMADQRRRQDGKPTVVHHHGMEVHRKLPDGTWVFFIDHPFGADPDWAVDAPPATQ